MGNDFEKMMNEKMEGASLEELMPDFDKQATWEELEQRIPGEEKKTKPVFAWWTHAATLAAGLIIGGIIIKSLTVTNPTQQTQPVATTTEQITTGEPEIIVKTDTVFITKEVPAAPVETPVQKAITPKPTQPKQETFIAQEETPKQKENKEQTIQPIIQEEIKKPQQAVAVASKQKQVKPIHLLDIDNEDRQDALYNNDPSAAKRSGFALHISTKRLPDNNNKQQPSILNKILKK